MRWHRSRRGNGIRTADQSYHIRLWLDKSGRRVNSAQFQWFSDRTAVTGRRSWVMIATRSLHSGVGRNGHQPVTWISSDISVSFTLYRTSFSHCAEDRAEFWNFWHRGCNRIHHVFILLADRRNMRRTYSTPVRGLDAAWSHD